MYLLKGSTLMFLGVGLLVVIRERERERDLLEGGDDFNGHIAGGGADDE